MTGGTPVLPIGTRGSTLALWQANHVADKIRRLPGCPSVELVRIKTEGARIVEIPISGVSGKAFFAKEIERALLDSQVDLAVHSLKNVATEMPTGLELGSVLEREDPGWIKESEVLGRLLAEKLLTQGGANILTEMGGREKQRTL